MIESSLTAVVASNSQPEEDGLRPALGGAGQRQTNLNKTRLIEQIKKAAK
jgi:hypothetical protein